MGVTNAGAYKEMTDDKLISFIRHHEDPVVTATEIATAFEMTNQGVNYRLKKLEKNGNAASKTVGASARVWYVPG